MPPPLPPPYVADSPTTYVTDSSARLVDPFKLEYVIFDVSTEAKRAAPVQLFPATGRANAERVSLGYFRAPYEAAPEEPRGRRLVRWFCILEEAASPRAWTSSWEVLVEPKLELGWAAYALVSDLRAEGFTALQLSDVRAQELLARASEIIYGVTGRTFAPVPKVLVVKGTRHARLRLDEEVIGLGEVLVERGSGPGASLEPLDTGDVFAYARHLTHRQMHPDDRDNPLLELAGGTWPRCTLHLSGVFGYTEPDGSPMGRTPWEISRAAMLLVRQQLAPLSFSSSSATGERIVIMQKTRDQEVRYAAPTQATIAATSNLTGDKEVDRILLKYVRPPNMGAA